MRLTNEDRILIIIIALMISITLIGIIQFICNANIHITYAINIDNNTLQAIKSVNWTEIYNQTK